MKVTIKGYTSLGSLRSHTFVILHRDILRSKVTTLVSLSSMIIFKLDLDNVDPTILPNLVERPTRG